MGKIMYNYNMELVENYDFINFTRHYKNINVNVYCIKNKNCRDKKTIANIIENSFYFDKMESELKKIGYILIINRRLLPNITIFNIIRDSKKARKLYNGRGANKIKFTLDTDLSDLD